MRIKKKNIARLASLSAVGAGALSVAAGNAEASRIEYTMFFHPPRIGATDWCGGSGCLFASFEHYNIGGLFSVVHNYFITSNSI
jgi:hypothetical protein